MHEAPANVRSQERIRPHWIYHMQSYPIMQEAIAVIRIRDHKVT